MEIQDVAVGNETSLAVTTLGELPEWVLRGAEVWLTAEDAGFALHHEASSVSVKGRAPADTSGMRQLLDGASPHLAWIRTRRNTDLDSPVIFLTVRRFPRRRRLDEAFVVEVNDLTVEDLRRSLGTQRRNMSEVLKFLMDEFMLGSDPREPDVAQVLSEEDDPEGLSRSMPERHRMFLSSAGALSSSVNQSSMSIHGRNFVADIQQTNSGTWSILRLTANRRKQDHSPWILDAPSEFADQTAASLNRELLSADLGDEIDSTRGFLRLWAEYQNLDRIEASKGAAKLGSVGFARVRETQDGNQRFDLVPDSQKFLQQLSVGEALQATTQPPDFRDGGQLLGREVFIGDVTQISFDPPMIDLDTNGKLVPPESGYLAASLSGDLRRLARRDSARAAIASGANPMPELIGLIEGREVPIRKVRRKEPLSPGVIAALGGAPTPRQVEALDIAINTPDVAVIQGPPGTGKSSVIAALQVRLAELEEVGHAGGSTLLSSFQHDAVEHVVSKTKILGLPGMKVGSRYGSGEGNTLPALLEWQRETSKKIRSLYPGSDLLNSLRAARLLRAKLAAATSDSIRGELLERAADLAPDPLSSRIRGSAVDSRLAKVEPASAWEQQLQPWIDRLADTSLDIEDRLTAACGARRLTEKLADGAGQGLVALSEWTDATDPPGELFTTAISDCKSLFESADSATETKPTDIATYGLLDDLVDALQSAVENSGDSIQAAALRFADRLEFDPTGARTLVQKYSTAFAATCQQAASGDMAALKNDLLEFENVIIDEAARANPLDLMIPMRMASRRIVLVGDHRQLPQMLEPDVEREVRLAIGDEFADRLRQSLFERLFDQLRTAEQTTASRRVVTLNTQFRMHPRLAEFLSETFYSEDGGLLSATGTENLVHGIPRFGERVAAWLDVPASAGSERRKNRSRERIVEAGRIAQLVRQLDEEAPDQSIGVITFYSGQRTLLNEAFQEVGLMHRGTEGTWRAIRTPGSEGQPRELRVGTVDAFQGTEFDIVILSIVRSNEDPCENAEQQRRKWGFLTLPNRMCVATSRQRKLLIVVGDASMAMGSAATWAPELKSLHDLCRNEEAYGS